MMVLMTTWEAGPGLGSLEISCRQPLLQECPKAMMMMMMVMMTTWEAGPGLGSIEISWRQPLLQECPKAMMMMMMTSWEAGSWSGSLKTSCRQPLLQECPKAMMIMITSQQHAMGISGLDLLRQVYVLTQWERSWRPHLPSHPVTVYWHWADHSYYRPKAPSRTATSVPILSHQCDCTKKSGVRSLDLQLSRWCLTGRPAGQSEPKHTYTARKTKPSHWLTHSTMMVVWSLLLLCSPARTLGLTILVWLLCVRLHSHHVGSHILTSGRVVWGDPNHKQHVNSDMYAGGRLAVTMHQTDLTFYSLFKQIWNGFIKWQINLICISHGKEIFDSKKLGLKRRIKTRTIYLKSNPLFILDGIPLLYKDLMTGLDGEPSLDTPWTHSRRCAAHRSRRPGKEERCRPILPAIPVSSHARTVPGPASLGSDTTATSVPMADGSNAEEHHHRFRWTTTAKILPMFTWVSKNNSTLVRIDLNIV